MIGSKTDKHKESELGRMQVWVISRCHQGRLPGGRRGHNTSESGMLKPTGLRAEKWNCICQPSGTDSNNHGQRGQPDSLSQNKRLCWRSRTDMVEASSCQEELTGRPGGLSLSFLVYTGHA